MTKNLEYPKYYRQEHFCRTYDVNDEDVVWDAPQRIFIINGQCLYDVWASFDESNQWSWKFIKVENEEATDDI